MSESEKRQLAVEHPSIRNMTDEERVEAIQRISITEEHLIEFLNKSGREWLIFRTEDLVRSIPPGGLEFVQQIVSCYRDYRSVQNSTTGELVEQKDVVSGKIVEIPKTKPETLEVAELDRLIRYLVGQITELDSTWTLDRPPM